MGRNDVRNLWIFTALVIVIGLVALFSASHENLRVERTIFYDQLFGAVFGMGIMYSLGRVPLRFYYDIAYPFYVLSVVLLLLVLVAGHSALGATRWFNVFGVRFQPSELSKVAVILMLARYFSQRPPKLSFSLRSSFDFFRRDLLVPLFLTLLSFGLIFKQPDLGSALLVFGIFIVMLYASGVAAGIFNAFLCGCAVMVPVGWHFLKEYQRNRLLVFLNPNIDPLGTGYNIIQSRIAVGSGQLFGKGWFSGTQNQLNFLPERHTDFIFSVIGEEWGYIGGVVLLGCYFMLAHTGLHIAQGLKDRFARQVALGITAILVLQVVINISMTIGLAPVVGITLPMVSYGRTSFLVFMVMIGILLSLARRR